MASPLLLDPFSLEPGTVLGGKYRVVRTLGQGGMGIVVAARHLELHEMVALKMLLPSAAANPVAVARFNREARASVKIKSPYVARVMDVGKLDTGVPFIVMEYLEGESLAARLRRTGPLPIRQTVEFIVQATHAVAEAHNLGIIHRDLKPANLFVLRHRDGTESIKVLDFGITKLLEATNRSMLETLTQTASPPGSPPYMAPEQLQDSSQIDHRVDIWALGITLFELLAGIRPFRGKTLTEVCLSILGDPLPKLRKLRPEVPAELEIAVQRCTAKDRDQRFADVGGLSLALAPFGHDVTHHTAERAARLAEQSGEHAVRRAPSFESAVRTERLSDKSIPPLPPRLAPSQSQGVSRAMLASQVTRTAAPDAVTRTSLTPGAAPAKRSKRLLWAAIVGLAVAAALGGKVALRRSAEDRQSPRGTNTDGWAAVPTHWEAPSASAVLQPGTTIPQPEIGVAPPPTATLGGAVSAAPQASAAFTSVPRTTRARTSSTASSRRATAESSAGLDATPLSSNPAEAAPAAAQDALGSPPKKPPKDYRR